jgi:transforming growth factor-beta-induced protein
MKKATTLFSTLLLLSASLMSVSSCDTANKDIVDVASEKAKTLTVALKAAGLVETLQSTGPFTVFAPTDAAFAAIQSDVDNLLKPENKEQLIKVLKCHVVSGKILSKDLKDGLTIMTVDGEKLNVSLMADGRFMVGDVHITTADIVAKNGIIHVVDKVILPTMKPKMAAKVSIVTVAAANAKTLSAAISAAGLSETLNGDGPFTVFAPTDSAFAAIQKDVDNLLKPDNKAKLAKILTYHVVARKVLASELNDGQVLTTVEGGKLTVSIKKGVVMVGKARVIATDVEASNGVIHVVDKVLMPKM